MRAVDSLAENSVTQQVSSLEDYQAELRFNPFEPGETPSFVLTFWDEEGNLFSPDQVHGILYPEDKPANRTTLYVRPDSHHPEVFFTEALVLTGEPHSIEAAIQNGENKQVFLFTVQAQSPMQPAAPAASGQTAALSTMIYLLIFAGLFFFTLLITQRFR